MDLWNSLCVVPVTAGRRRRKGLEKRQNDGPNWALTLMLVLERSLKHSCTDSRKKKVKKKIDYIKFLLTK